MLGRTRFGHACTQSATRASKGSVRTIAGTAVVGLVSFALVVGVATSTSAAQSKSAGSSSVMADVSRLSLVDPDEVPQAVIDAFAAIEDRLVSNMASTSGIAELNNNPVIEIGTPLNLYLLDEARGSDWLEERSAEIGGWELAVLYDHRNQYCAPTTINNVPSSIYLCAEMYSRTEDPSALTDLLVNYFVKLDLVTPAQQKEGFPGHLIALREGHVTSDFTTVTALDNAGLGLVGQASADEDDFARKYFTELKERDLINGEERGEAVPVPLYNATPKQLEQRSRALQDVEESSPLNAAKRALGVGAIVLVVGLAIVAVAFSVRRKDS